MFGQKLNKEQLADMGRQAEANLARIYIYGPNVVVGAPFIPDNEHIAQELVNMANMQQAQGTVRDLLIVAAARLAASNVVMAPPHMDDTFQGSTCGPFEHVRSELIATSAAVQHHFIDRNKNVHTVVCDNTGAIKSRQIMGEKASEEWMHMNNHRNRF